MFRDVHLICLYVSITIARPIKLAPLSFEHGSKRIQGIGSWFQLFRAAKLFSR